VEGTRYLVHYGEQLSIDHVSIHSKENTMRGPGLRIQYDTRRLWQCPECQYERHVPGRLTSMQCHCQKPGPFMKLMEEQRITRPPGEERNLYVEFTEEELAAMEEESSSKSKPSRRSKKKSKKAEQRIEEKAEQVSNDDFGAGIEEEKPSSTEEKSESVTKEPAEQTEAPADTKAEERPVAESPEQVDGEASLEQ